MIKTIHIYQLIQLLKWAVKLLLELPSCQVALLLLSCLKVLIQNILLDLEHLVPFTYSY